MMCINDHTRVCPVCGTIHYPPDLQNYAYKKVVKKGKQTITYYFCRYNCFRQ